MRTMTMTTTIEHGGRDDRLRSLTRPARSAAAPAGRARGDRDARVTRWIAAGALAAFLSLFGLTVAIDRTEAPPPAQVIYQSVDPAGTADDVSVITDEPQIRTRTS